MPDISVTDDQRERLRELQEHLAEDVTYGHVRPRDALEYLLDRFEAESSPGNGSVASTTATATGSDGDAEPELDVRNGGQAGEAEARIVDAADAATTSDDSGETDDSGATDDSGEAADSGAADDSETADDDARLNSVMSLLKDNADVWRETDSGEEKYEVDLPDGGTERARTKDDVRAVLFKHYR